MNVNQCIPAHNNVLIKPDPVEEVKSGVDLGDDNKDRSTTGTVIAVSKNKKADDFFAEEGMRVMYGSWAGIPITMGADNYLLIKDSDILCQI